MRSAFIVIVLLAGAVVLLASASPAVAADAGPVTAPPPAAPAAAAAPAATPPKAATSPVFGKPLPSAQLRYNEGEALARAQAWPQAETAYAEATKLNPDFAEAWNGLGHARKMQRRYPEALERARSLDPTAGPFDSYRADIERDCITGTPERAAARIAEYEAAGVQRIFLNDELYDDLAMLELLATDVLPRLTPAVEA